jgi:hypothetical protein
MLHLLTPLLLTCAPPVTLAHDSLLVEIGGRVTVLRSPDLRQLPRDSVQWSDHGAVHTYSGVRLIVLLRHVGMPVDTLRRAELTKRLVVEAADGYRVVFTLAEVAPGLGSREVLVADREDGEPLSAFAGPLRLVVPADGSGARSVRQVIALRVRDES